MTGTAEFYYQFCEAAHLNKTHSPYKRRCKDGQQFGWFRIVSCKNEKWWYRDYIGVEFLGEFRYRTFPGLPVPPRLYEVIVTRRVGRVYEVKGRTVAIEDVVLL